MRALRPAVPGRCGGGAVLIFPGWREVGRAMRWARKQDGVEVRLTPTRGVLARGRRYLRPGGTQVHVYTIPGATWFKTFSGVVGSAHVTPEDAAQALRVLAALDLIPAELAKFRTVPWAWKPGDDVSTFPLDDTPDDGDCPERFRRYLYCTLAAGHSGNHRAGDGSHIVAEWPQSAEVAPC